MSNNTITSNNNTFVKLRKHNELKKEFNKYLIIKNYVGYLI